MRFFFMECVMPPPQKRKRDSGRAWLSGLAITLTTIVSLLGFWRLAPGTTFAIAVVALIGVAISFWVAGKPS